MYVPFTNAIRRTTFSRKLARARQERRMKITKRNSLWELIQSFRTSLICHYNRNTLFRCLFLLVNKSYREFLNDVRIRYLKR